MGFVSRLVFGHYHRLVRCHIVLSLFCFFRLDIVRGVLPLGNFGEVLEWEKAG